MANYSLSFISGVVLLVTNPIVGWGGIILSIFLYKKSKKKIYLLLGTLTYILSWLMLTLGTVLAGPTSLKLLKAFVKDNIVLTCVAVLGLAYLYYLYLKNRKRK